ncbi:mediator of RNA polymerase II transcription subunit 17 [Physcomitrium patens]|uniref:Uncharacterized protein n=3 Tax=Physcomitrium patens TaxID=3218 RepID=A0A2K1KVY4_PHYPA|nr:mediator of RNA polymerase II transcription subunit 17-like isoform X1 [Physcomitrium patens]PNR57955.1 hypothetical protein PHYPA_004949 [Physcomitrium patens]|eukprot:XP_024372278.1 mediator of RNA polymerase II transcription subunit 17-like isoform X1 [Physcomitrella patens]
MEVSLDPLPLKRVLAMEESGTELLPPEPSQEEKSLALLGRLDFGQEFKKIKKEEDGNKKEEKEKEIVQVWPWQGLVDHLQQAHHELAIILDMINHVEAGEAVAVARMERPKLQPQEICSDVALRASSKLHHFRNVGKYLKRSAQSLEQQVEREAVFYGALMRLQRNWKVKRQRGVAAGPGGSAGFSIDVGTSESAPCLITLEQNSVGLLTAHLPAALTLSSLHVTLLSTPAPFKFGKDTERLSATSKEGTSDATVLPEAPKPGERGVGPGVDRGATRTQAMLRQIQTANFDAQVFEWVGRQALSLSPYINVTGLSDTCLQLSLGNAASLNVHLTPMAPIADESQGSDKVLAPRTPDHQNPRLLPNEGSLSVCLQQAYQRHLHGRDDNALSKETGKHKDGYAESAGLVKHVSAIMKHRVASDKIISVLEKQVHGVPELRFISHPTWHAQVSTWDLWLDVPDSALLGRWQASVVLREDMLTIAGLPSGNGNRLTSTACTLSELSPFLLFQMAAHLVTWLHAEASGMGVEARLDSLSITFELDNFEDVSLVASPAVKSHTINWSLRLSGSRTEDSDATSRFLGPLPLETLRAIVIDLMNEKLDVKPAGDASLRGEGFFGA